MNHEDPRNPKPHMLKSIRDAVKSIESDSSIEKLFLMIGTRKEVKRYYLSGISNEDYLNLTDKERWVNSNKMDALFSKL